MVSNGIIKLTREERYAIEDEIRGKKYYVHEYFNLPRTVQTDVCCPKCKEMLMYIQVGASYTIKCPRVGCVEIGVRGI